MNLISSFDLDLPDVLKNTYTKYQNTVLIALTTATLLLVSLAWNDVVQETITMYYPRESRQNIKGKVYYALIITIFVVLVQIYIFPYIY